MIKRLLGPAACAAAMILSGTPATTVSAADFTPPPEPYIEAYVPSWSGCYIGGHGGGAWFDHDGNLDGAPDVSIDGDGVLYGALGGCQWQSGNLVFGIEGDVSFGEVDGSSGAIDDFDVEPVGTIRGRLGMPLSDRLLPFVTVGLGIADADARATGLGVDSQTHLGLVAGGGMDFRITDNISLRGEFLAHFYGEEEYEYAGGFTDKHDFDLFVARGALVWHFGCGTPFFGGAC